MIFGPVLRAELLTTARRRRYYLLRAVLTLLMLWIFMVSDIGCRGFDGRYRATMTVQRIANVSQELFVVYMCVLGGAVALLTPAVTAGVIAEEKQRKTLHYLLASQLDSFEIVFDKMAARILLIVLLLTASLPILALTNLFGGVPPQWYFAFYVSALSLTFFLACLSILVSVYVKRARDALITVYMLILLWGFVPSFIEAFPLFGWIWPQVYQWIGWANRWLAICSPLTATFILSGAPISFRGDALNDLLLKMCGSQIAWGLLMLTWAILRLRPVYRKQASEGPGSKRWARWRGLWSRLRRPCGDDPMMWKERHFSRLGTLPQIAGALVLIGFGVVLGIGLYFLYSPALEELWAYGYFAEFSEDIKTGMSYWNSTQWRKRNDLNEFLRGYSGTIYVFIALAVAARAAAGITTEKEQDSWISLVSTPLASWSILRAKMLGSILGVIWLPIGLIALWIFGAIMGSVHPIGLLLSMLLLVIYLWFVAALGTFVSLGAKSTMRAQIITVVLLIICNGGYLLCCMTPFMFSSGPPPIAILAGVTPAQIGYGLISYWDIHAIMHPGSHPIYSHPTPGESTVMVIFSLILYAIGSILMTWAAAKRFDRLVDRPKRAFGPRPQPDDPDAKPKPTDKDADLILD